MQNRNPRHGRRRPRPLTLGACIAIGLISAVVLASLILAAVVAVDPI